MIKGGAMKQEYILRLGENYYKNGSRYILELTSELSEAKIFYNIIKLRELVIVLNCGLIIEKIKDGKLVVSKGPREIVIDGNIVDDHSDSIIEYIR